MKLLCIFAALLVCVCAQEWYDGEELSFVDNSEYQYRLDQLRKQRDRRPKREVTGSIPVGDNGKLIGTLGDTAKGGLYGTGAYEHTLINNDGGRLAAQAYGTRVLNPNKDSTLYGGKLAWTDSNVHASADASKRIGLNPFKPRLIEYHSVETKQHCQILIYFGRSYNTKLLTQMYH
ncbi:uncharacterized protein LOC125239000 [Leguminivora glycinivorella]|uniref:uncharacterized protein LOC125239000 n=1 Tax=Leguminivora glycinivorella TaxID=1035111 RepID=UPI002010C485|nr:uncharacterized protein LOC125239000 [Leguminivora glycinivorella]